MKRTKKKAAATIDALIPVWTVDLLELMQSGRITPAQALGRMAQKVKGAHNV